MHNQKTNDTDEFITQVLVKELEAVGGYLSGNSGHDN